MAAVTFLEFTPPRIQKNDHDKEDSEPIVLVLAPFNPPAKIFFEDTKLNETRTKPVIVRNPSSTAINVVLDKLPEPGSHLSFSETQFTVAAASQLQLVVTWEALKAESLRHVVHLKDQKNNKKLSEIVVTAACPVVPVKKKSRFAKKNPVLRTKVLTNRVVANSPEPARAPLKKEIPSNVENTFIVPGKDFELQHADLPTTPRRETYLVENKENTPLSVKRKRPAEGFRKTMMKPPPAITANRKRKVPQVEASLEIKECFSEDEPSRPLRRSTYSLNSPGSNSLSAIANSQPPTNNQCEKEALVNYVDTVKNDSLNKFDVIDVSTGSSDVFMITRDSPDRNMQSTDRPTAQKPVNHNQSVKHDRFSIDSLNGPDLSFESSDVARDSLDSDQTKKSYSPLQTVPQASLENARASMPSINETLNENNAKVQVQIANLFEEPSYMSLEKTWEKKVHYDSRILSPTATPSNPVNSPTWQSTEQLSPLHFSPSFNPKRCTFIKDPAPCGSGSSLNNVSYTIIDEDEENTFCDFKLNTPRIETPCEGKHAAAKSIFSASHKIIEADTPELNDLRLRTPQITTPRSHKQVISEKPEGLFSSPDVVDLSFEKSPWKSSPLESIHENLVLKTPILLTPFAKLHRNSTQTPVCGKACSSTSTEQLISEPKSAKILPLEMKKFSEEELEFEAENFQNSTPEDFKPPPLPGNSSNASASSNKHVAVADVVTPCHELEFENIQSAPMNLWPCSVSETQHANLRTSSAEISTLRLTSGSERKAVNKERVLSTLLEISPPKKNHLKKASPLASMAKQPIKPSRVLARSISAKSVISPMQRVKRLSAAHKSATPRASLAKSAPSIEVKRAVKIHCTGPVSNSEKNITLRKRYTGVPMSSLKLKPLKRSTGNAEERKSESVKNMVSRLKSSEKEVLSPDHYIRSLSQPADYMFFFSETSKTDPFISNSLYYDPEWLDRQEADLIKWLNSLLTPPAELEADSAGHWRVDVAALWKKSQTSKVDLAPSKEAVSSQYLTRSRLDIVRKAAGTLFRGDLAPTCCKLAVSINKKVLSVRDDKDLHLDYGLKCKVLSLLLCYNPLWLRIGLETIYGRPILLSSNSDVVGLTNFIRRYLLSDDYLKKKHSHAKVPSLYLPSFGEEMKKFILRKFFMLVYFLDQAKMRKLIRHDPCLFVTSSPFKSSRDLIVEFAKDLIAGLGDITKYLRSFGYNLEHKQTFLDEFNYAVSSRQDLRDGVRLTRVMEIILSIHTLSSKLRTPAISRLQKIHNVDIALKALQEAGYVIQGEIVSKDIVDGHREKTLSLLWQIIYRFQAPRYEKAAVKLQTWWRKNSLRFEIQKRIRIKRLAKQNEAATRIQALWRGFITRRKMVSLKEQLLAEREARTKAAIMIQKQWRKYVAQKRFKSLQTAVIKIQRWFRAKQPTPQRQEFVKLRNAVVVAQRRFRANKQAQVERQKYVALHNAAVFVQRHFRCNRVTKTCRQEYLTLRTVTILVQRRFRANKQAKLQREAFISLRQSVIYVQQHYRAKLAGRKCCHEYKELKKATCFVQETFRKNRAMRDCREKYLTQRRAAIVIQRWFRMKMVRHRFLALKSAALIIQKHFQAWQAMKANRQAFMELRHAAIVLQTRFRANQLAKEERGKFLLLKNAAVHIQQQYRAKKAAQVERKQFEALKSAVICVQRQWRSKKATERQRQEYLKLRVAAIVLQKHFRRCLARRKYLALVSAAITIQTRWRANILAKQARADFLLMRRAAIFVQQTYRGNKIAILCKNRFLQLKSAVVYIQQKFRAKKAMEKCRREYQELLVAAIIVQTRFRANLLAKEMRQEFLMYKSAATVIQSRFRAQKAMVARRKEYQQLKVAVLFVQQKFRAKKAMEKCREEYQQLLFATLITQARFRANLLAKKARQEFLMYRSAAIVIQSRFRAQKAMVACRTDFQQLKTAAIFVQQKFRAKKAMEKCRGEYQNLLVSTRIIQIRFRANLLARKMRHEFLILKSAAITIQHQFRAKKAMMARRTEYQRLKAAAIFVQQKFRAKKAMEKYHGNYQQLLFATRTMQARFRANLLAKKMRREFLMYKSATILIQSRFRAQKAMIASRTEYQQLKSAAIFVQRKFRAKIAMEKCRKEYQDLLAATRIIQARFRANLLAKEMHQEFLMKKSATIIIQRQFRAQKAMIASRTEYQQLKSAAIFVQRKFRAKIAMEKCCKEYQDLLAATQIIQARFRANLLAKKIHQEFLMKKSATIIIQRQFRAQKAMVTCRTEYQQLKSAAIFVQQKFRAKRTMEECRREYQNLLVATRIIQARFRANLVAKKTRQEFLMRKSAAILIQRQFRAQKAMVTCRAEYQQLKSAAVFVQQKFRAKKAMEQCRSEFECQRKAAIFIQQKFRAILIAKEIRCKFLVQRKAAIVIQRWYRYKMFVVRQKALSCAAVVVQRRWRAIREARVQRREFDQLKRTVVWMQQKWRGKKLVQLEMERYQAMRVEMKEILAERRERERRKAAATKIQALWRGFQTRKTVKLPKSNKQNVQLVNVVAVPSQKGQTLQIRYDWAMEQILSPNADLQVFITAFMNLDTITYLSPILCDELVDGELVKIVYFQLAHANRSVPYQELCVAGFRILINLVRYPNTAPSVWQETLDCNGISVLLGFLRIYCEKNITLFCQAATLLWLFSDDPIKSAAINNNETCGKTLTYVLDRLRRKTPKFDPKAKPLKASNKVTPSKTADWGLTNKLKVFENPLHATIALCQNLNIPVKLK